MSKVLHIQDCYSKLPEDFKISCIRRKLKGLAMEKLREKYILSTQGK